jgi:hypothetical protein
MKRLISEPKAAFGYKTTDILKYMLCCRMLMKRSKMRTRLDRRRDLYFKLGLEHIDKELDIGNLVKKIRILTFFMKMILDTD